MSNLKIQNIAYYLIFWFWKFIIQAMHVAERMANSHLFWGFYARTATSMLLAYNLLWLGKI